MNRYLFTTLTTCAMLASAIAAGDARPSASFEDRFDSGTLDESVWIRGGSNNPVQTVREGTLRLVSNGMMNQSFVATKRDDFNFFKKPITLVWDLAAGKTLAGPYAATLYSKAYAGLQIGATTVAKRDAWGGAQLGLTAWPGEVAAKGFDAPWFYTLNLGRLMPNDPAKSYGPGWVDEWKISGVPQRLIWSLGPVDWSVEIQGARFVNGDPQKRSGHHELKEADFDATGFHLLVFASAAVASMEPGANFLSASVYTDALTVDPPAGMMLSPPALEQSPRLTIPSVLKKLLGEASAEGASPSKPQSLFGVNYAGGTFRPKEGFVVPTEESLDYWKSKGVMLMRLPFNWEPLQPTLGGPLDKAYITNLKRTVDMMGARGMKVILDLHNYDRYNGQLIGSESVPYEAFADVWKRLATEFTGHPAIWGYGLMNEPYRTKGTWPKAAQAGLDGVRAVDRQTRVVIGGDEFSGARDWMKNGAGLAEQIVDPASNLCWEAHCYFDSNFSGKYSTTYEYDLNRKNSDLDPQVGVKRLAPFVDWLKKNHYQGLVGEFSVPVNLDRDPRWLEVLDNAYDYLGRNNIPNTFWAAGTLWTPGRAYVLEPNWHDGPSRGLDRPQTLILLKHARARFGAAQ